MPYGWTEEDIRDLLWDPETADLQLHNGDARDACVRYWIQYKEFNDRLKFKKYITKVFPAEENRDLRSQLLLAHHKVTGERGRRKRGRSRRNDQTDPRPCPPVASLFANHSRKNTISLSDMLPH